MINISHGATNGSSLSEILFTLSDKSDIFTISKPLNNQSPSQFLLTSADNSLIANYKEFEIVASVKNSRGDSKYSVGTVFSPSDLPNDPIITSIVESDKSLSVSWSRPSDYNDWRAESYTSIVQVEFKDEVMNTWTSVDLEKDETSHILSSLVNGRLFEVRVRYQNDNGYGVWSAVETGMPHKQANAPENMLSALNIDFVSILSTVEETGGLGFKKLVCDVYDGDVLKETVEQTDIPYNSANQFTFRKAIYDWLVSGTNYKFKTYVVTQSAQANMSAELIGHVSEVEATYFDKIPDMSALSLVAGDSAMSVSWTALSGFDMPVKSLKYEVFMNGAVVASELETNTFMKTGLANGVIHSFVVKASFDLIEDIRRSFTVETEPKSLSAFKKPDAPSNLTVSKLASTSLTLSWTAGDLNGTKHSKYKIFNGETLLKEVVADSVVLTGLTKGQDYQLSVMTVATRNELVGETFLSDKSAQRTTRPYSSPSKVTSLTADVLDKSLKINWLEPLDFGGYPLVQYDVRFISNPSGSWLVVNNVQSGHILTGLENGKEYQVRVSVVTYNSELETTLTSLTEIVYATPLSTSSLVRNMTVEALNSSFKVFWDAPETDNGSPIMKYYIDVLNTTTGQLQVLSLTKDLREKVVTGLNGNEYSVSMRAVNAIGNSESNSAVSVIPFGLQTISNVIISNKTISFDVKTNGRKVDDVSVLAIDSSPNVNENLFMASANNDAVVIGNQSFSKTFNFNQNILKYLIIVRSASGQITKTNFNV